MALYAMEMQLKYLPSLIVGVLLWGVLIYIFSLAGVYSPLLDYLSSDASINENSPKYLLLALHDTFIKLLVCFVFLYSYKKLFTKLPFNFISSLIIQFPTVLMITSITLQGLKYSNFPNFSSYYGVVDIIGLIVTCTSVMLVYWLMVLYNKKIN
jgi:hypothetical protein